MTKKPTNLQLRKNKDKLFLKIWFACPFQKQVTERKRFNKQIYVGNQIRSISVQSLNGLHF